MSSIVFLRNKKNGKVYAYVNEKKYDFDKGKDVYKRKCIGHLDPVSGEIIPNRVKEETQSPKVIPCGQTLFLKKIAEEIGLTESLQIVFPDNWKIILTCAMYVLCERSPLSNITEWLNVNDSIIEDSIDMEQIRQVLSRITQYDIDSFTTVWKRRVNFKDFSIMSVSPITSYVDRVATSFSENIIFSSAVDLEICCAGYVPFAFVTHSVGLNDVHEMFGVKNNFEKFGVTEFNRMARSNLCKDFKMDDLNSYYKSFSIEVPKDGELFRQLMEDNLESIFSSNLSFGEESSFTATIKKRMGGRSVYIHFYYDADDAESETSAFLSMIERCRFELDHGHLVPSHNSIYETYFLITQEEGEYAKFELNSEAIMKRNNFSGFHIILTDNVANAEKERLLYKINRNAEFVFDNMYNVTDRMKLKLYTRQMDEARTFIQFLSLILKASVYNRIKDDFKGYTVSDVMRILKHVYYVDMHGRKNLLESDLTDEQMSILSSVGVRFGRYDGI